MKTVSLTVHMIGNAHLDPVWLWHWQRGSDEALATCRAACDLLDDYPDAVFTRGEAWVYEQVRQFDPALFRRIRSHIAAGRWEVSGGWWVQADTNLPTAEATRASIELGHAWFREHLGIKDIPVAYLVDTFGHGAFLPRIIRQAGQRYFVMMRPGPQELPLPSHLFRWRSPDGHDVLTFRIIGSYLANGPDLSGPVNEAIRCAPDGVGHVMCFYGVGDHGGGPTRASVEWIRAHRDYAPGVRLEFSSPARFFAAVEPYRDACPKVEGELQMHAIGCYSVCGALKRDLREAELGATDVAALVRRSGGTMAVEIPALTEAWRVIAFNQFHDIVTGSAVRSALDTACRQVAAAKSAVDNLVHDNLRRRADSNGRGMIAGHRLHVVNRLERPWSGLVEAEIWFDWQKWRHRLESADGQVVPVQLIPPESLMINDYGGWLTPIPRLLFHADLAAGSAWCARIVDGPRSTAEPSGQTPGLEGLVLGNGRVNVTLGRMGIEQVRELDGPGRECLAAPLSFVALADASDTWSHGRDRFGGPAVATAQFGGPVLHEQGIWRTTVRLDGRLGADRCRLFVSLCRNEIAVRLRLSMNYQEPMTVLKVVLAPIGGITGHEDRVAGGWLRRAPNGREYPVHHASRLETGHGPLGLVLPDTFAADVSEQAARPTLIRNSFNAMDNAGSTLMAEHPVLHNRFGTDEGPQDIRLTLALGADLTTERLDSLLDADQRPPYVWDDFRGISRVRRFERK